MGLIRTSRPSPAIVVAVLALVAALAGTALAGPNATTSAISKKKAKKIAKKQAINQINELAPGLSVAKAESADTAANASALGGLAANQLVRSASAASENRLTGGGANGPVLQTTITAPRNGHLQITASSDVHLSVADQGIACVLSVDGSDVPGSRRVLLGDTGETLKDNIENCTTNGTSRVSGGSHTVRLDLSGVNDANVDERALDVLFVPFGATGG